MNAAFRSCLVLMVTTAIAGNVSAQAADTKLVRLAVADYLMGHAKAIKSTRDVVYHFDSGIVDRFYDTQLRADKRQGVARSSTELSELSGRFGAALVTQDQDYPCNRTGSRCEYARTNVRRIRIGEPNVAGDSATVVYTEDRVAGKPGDMGIARDYYVAWLHHGITGWKVVAIGGGNAPPNVVRHPVKENGGI
jgi:hypothetical protein